MKAEEYFIEDLPDPLPREEVKELFIKYSKGNLNAREIIILHNLRLIALRLNYVYDTVNYDKKDLFSIGIIGLIKAVDNFDISKKNCEFSSYAVRCIDNEILMFLRQLKKEVILVSLERTVYQNKDDSVIKLIDTLISNEDFVLENENKIIIEKIKNLVSSLPERKKYVVESSFGFNGTPKLQKELAIELRCTQTGISNILRRTLDKIKTELENEDLIETNNLRKRRRLVKEPIY